MATSLFVATLGGVLWSFIKVVLRFVTGRGELQRACAPAVHTPVASAAFEASLRSSRQLAHLWQKRHDHTDPDRVEAAIIEIKGIQGWNRPNLRRCTLDVIACQRLMVLVETARKIAYDKTNPEHESKLLALWDDLMPDEPLKARRSDQWGTIGFQGMDPATDFRGMGLVGLEQLCYFAKHEQRVAQAVLRGSLDPKYGYSMAIVGINITGYVLRLLKSGKLNIFIYSKLKGRPSSDGEIMLALNMAYTQLFDGFGRFWLAAKPKNMMAFNEVFGDFGKIVEAQLEDTKGWVEKSSFAL